MESSRALECENVEFRRGPSASTARKEMRDSLEIYVNSVNGGQGRGAMPLLGAPCPAGRPVWTGNDYNIAVGVPYPAFPVIRTTVAISGVSVPGHDDLHTHFRSAVHDLVKIVDLEP